MANMDRGAVRDKGTGSLYQRADGYWCASLEVPGTGTRRRKVVVRRRKGDAVAELRRLRAELDRTGTLATSVPTVGVWLGDWIERRERERLKPRTAATYRGYITNHIIPAVGRVRLDRLTPGHVERLRDTMTGAGLSSTSALQAHRILQKALADAERAGHVQRNVAALAEAPRRAVATRPALTAEQARTLLRATQDDPDLYVRWSLALLAGLRQGERLGLGREQVDLEAGVLTVSWQLQRLQWRHGCGGACGLTPARCPDRMVPIPPDQEATQVSGGLWLTRPKSRAGWRQVPLAPALEATLRLHLDRTEPVPDALVLHEAGRPVDPRRDAAAWHACLAAAGLPAVPLHSARHTCSTLLYEAGVDEQTRMSILGHSSAAVTRGYTHVSTPMARDAVLALDGMLALE